MTPIEGGILGAFIVVGGIAAIGAILYYLTPRRMR